MSRSGSLIKNTIVFAIGSIGSKLLQFLLLPLYTHVLTDAQYGIADVLHSIATVATPLLSLTVYESVFRYAMDKVTDPRDVFSTGMHSCLLSALASVLVGLVCIGSGMDTGYVWAVVGYTVANFFSITFLQFIRAVGHVRLYALSNILQTLLIVIFNVAFLVHFQWGEEGYMLGYTLSNALVTVIIFFAARLWRYYHPRLSDSRTVTRMLRYSIPLIPSAVCWWLTTSIGRLMITHYLGSDANGPFAVAFKIPTIVVIAVGTFIQAWQMSANMEFDSPDFAQFNSKAFGFLQTLSFLMAAFLALCSKLIISLMGAEFREAWVYIPVMMMGIAFYTFAQFLGSLYIASKRTVMDFVTNLITAVLNILGNLWLLPKIGAMGAAVSIAGSYLIFWLLRLVDTRSITKLRYDLFTLLVNILLMGLLTLTVTLSFPGWIPVGIGLFVLMLVNNLKNLLSLCRTLLQLLKNRIKKA